MRDHDNLAALIDDAGALADQYCASLPCASGLASLRADSPVAEKAQAYADMLYCRFADQAFSAARSARHGRPATTSSLVRSAFDTFTRLHELRDHLEGAFRKNSLDGLDQLVTSRLFSVGEETEEDEEEEGFSMGLAGDEAEEPQRNRHHAPDNDCNDADHGYGRVDPGACIHDRQAEQALLRLMRTLIAVETSFEACHRALEEPMSRLDELMGGRRFVPGRAQAGGPF